MNAHMYIKFVLLKIFKMPTIVDFLKFISRTNYIACCSEQEHLILIFVQITNFMIQWFEHEKCLIASVHDCNISMRAHRKYILLFFIYVQLLYKVFQMYTPNVILLSIVFT